MYHIKRVIPQGLAFDESDGYDAAFSDYDGGYIGDIGFAEMLKERGIQPRKAKATDEHCSIGFNKQEGKWYGFSHRGICGFGIGDSVKEGDVAYTPKDWDDLVESAKRFWGNDEDYHENVTAKRHVDEHGQSCVKVEWIYTKDTPNKSLRGTKGSSIMYPPPRWGNGEWKATNPAQCRRMAMDYAENIAKLRDY